MLKKIKAVSTLVALSAPAFSCNSTLLELNKKDITYIVNDASRTAIVRSIYIGINEYKKDVTIPANIDFKYYGSYTVVGVLPNAVKDISTKLKSVVLPKTLINNEKIKRCLRF